MSRNNKVISVNTSINPLESLFNILPCDRPIRALQLIENIQDCPQDFIPIHKTLDLDSDADIFKENILFGKRNTRYLCISKTQGVPNFVLEKIKIISASEHLASDGFISIKNTADTNQKAWRKKQIVYKLTKTENITECITDIVVLNKYKSPPPEGYVYLGELEKVHICYKTLPYKPASEIIDFTQQIENLRIQANNNSVYPTVNNTTTDHYYESLNLSYQLPTSSPTCASNISNNFNNNQQQQRPLPLRKAPLPPTSPTTAMTHNNNNNTGTLSHYHNDCFGIPFALHKNLTKSDYSFFEIPKNYTQTDTLDYDFTLERQILCSTRDENRKSTSNNPFF